MIHLILMLLSYLFIGFLIAILYRVQAIRNDPWPWELGLIVFVILIWPAALIQFIIQFIFESADKVPNAFEKLCRRLSGK